MKGIRFKSDTLNLSKEVGLFRQSPLAPMALALLVCTVTACAAINNKTRASLPQQAEGQEKRDAATDSPPNTERVLRLEGWEIPGLAVSVEVGKRSLFKTAGTKVPQLYWTWLRPKTKLDEEFFIDDNYFTGHERGALHLLPGKLAVIKIVRYDIQQKPFCYVVFIHPQGVGATNGLAYYDEDGDGKFEGVERASVLPSFVPQLPTWAQLSH